MGLWIFMMIMNLLIPVTMVVFGLCFIKKAPKEINKHYGYRTAMSVKNKDTWQFAHNYCGEIWLKWGLLLLSASVVLMIITIKQNIETISNVSVVLCIVQLVVMMYSIVPTEKALKRTFDENGNRK